MFDLLSVDLKAHVFCMMLARSYANMDFELPLVVKDGDKPWS